MSRESAAAAMASFSDPTTPGLFAEAADVLLDFERHLLQRSDDRSAIRSTAKLLLSSCLERTQRDPMWEPVLSEALVRVEFVPPTDVTLRARYWASQLASIARLGRESDPDVVKAVSRFCLAVSNAQAWRSKVC